MLLRLSLCMLLAGCARTPQELVLSGPTMGTTYSVKVAAPPAGIHANVVRVAVDEVLERIDRDMSGYRDDSTISRFNASASTEWFEVSDDLVKVVGAALKVSEQSQGALDISVAPLVNLWGMGPAGERAQLPSDDEIQQVQARVGYRRLQVREQSPALRKGLPELTVDLNAVAPGYAVDLLAARLSSMGVVNFMIDIGGEVRARGRNARGESWRIAVERPVDAQPEPYAIVQLDNMSITTSGEYRHYVMRDGHRYSHTIDPRTGRPVEHTLASVVVISATSLEADAWATAFNVLGAQAGYALAAQREMPVMFIVEEGGKLRNRMTPQFGKYLAVAHRRTRDRRCNARDDDIRVDFPSALSC